MFKKLVKDPYKNEKKILDILLQEINKVTNKNFKDTFFYKYGFEISFAFTANKDLFWKFYTYFDKEKNIIEDETDEILNKEGIVVIKHFFNEEQVDKLKQDWQEYFNNFIEFNDYELEYARRHDAVFKNIEDTTYTLCSESIGKKRIIIHDREKLLPNFKNLLDNNNFFTQKIKNYFNIKYNYFTQNAIMAEHLYSPIFYRKDKYWHIDTLKDQIKVMIILEDMNENDGPFTYIPESQKLMAKYQNKYHQIYKMTGFKTTPCDHFSDDFLYNDNIKSAILKKGDIAIFDTRLHHTATFPYSNGERKNILLYFGTLPTIRNIIFTNLDKYKDVLF